MALHAVCQWLVEREDVVKWAQLFMACKEIMDIAQPELQREREHKQAVLDWALERLSLDLDRLTAPPWHHRSFRGRLRGRLDDLEEFVHEVMTLSMLGKLDALPQIKAYVRDVLWALMSDIDEITDRPVDAVDRLQIGLSLEDLADLKHVWRLFTRNVALRRAPDEPARPSGQSPPF
jgi:hypothetical protein